MYNETTHDGQGALDDHDHHGPAKGLMRWVTTTNHKDIGTLYLWLAFTMLLYGGSMAMVIRLELFQPGLQWVEPHFFNQMTTMHGLVMVFGAIMPAFVGLANWLIPIMIGAPDMALPRMNNCLDPAVCLHYAGFDCLHGRWWTCLWLDFLRPAVDDLCTGVNRLLHFCSAFDGYLVGDGCDQRYRHHFEHARTRYVSDEDAIVRVDMVDHRLSADCRYAGVGWCGHHDVDGSSFRNLVLRCRRRR